RARDIHPADRARHGVRHGHRRRGHGAGLRPPHSPWLTASSATRSRGDPRLSREPEQGGTAVSHFLTLVVNGLSLGCIDALIALGFVIVFKAARVVNFAYGSLLLLGAYVIGRTHESLGFLAAVLLGVTLTA